MKHIALCLDYDGSVEYPFKANYQNSTLFVINFNKKLWVFIEEICKENPDLETLTLTHFSGRQNFVTDFFASETNENESYFLAMKKIEIHLVELLRTSAPSVKVKLNCLLMPDIYFNVEQGVAHKTVIENIAHVQVVGKYAEKHHDYNFLGDEFKRSYVFAYVHAIGAEAYYFLDDRLDILESINEFYNNDTGKSFLPNGTIVRLLNYDLGKFEPSFSATIEGTGSRCVCFSQILRDAYKHSPTSFPDLEIFAQIYRKHMGVGAPLKLLAHPNSDSAENAITTDKNVKVDLEGRGQVLNALAVPVGYAQSTSLVFASEKTEETLQTSFSVSQRQLVTNKFQ